jgi:hypothetical protein
MADLQSYGVASAPEVTSQTETPVPDRDLASYKYAKALCEAARTASADRVRQIQSNWEFLRGKNQWDVAGNRAAQRQEQDSFRGVVNWCYSVIKTKSAMICGAPTDVFCDPIDDESTYEQRNQVKAVIEDDLARNNFKEIKRSAYLSGSATGIGVSMLTLQPDNLTGTLKTVLSSVKSEEFFQDPSADSTRSEACRFVVWEPILDMSTIRQMWPSKADQVRPDYRQVTGGFTYKPDRTDDNLIYGTAGEFSVDKGNILRARKAKVSFVWIRDESVITDIEKVVLREARPGYRCISCGAVQEADAAPPGTDGCAFCQGDLEPVQIPDQIQENKIIRKHYPYGRLIAYAGETLLFDGDNPYEIETVFPFAVYQHDPIPGDFRGENDVALLGSLQREQNRTVGQLIDYVRAAVNGPVCYPVAYTAIHDLGNGPGTPLPGPNVLPWKPFILRPEGFDVQCWGALHNALTQHFQVVSGLAQSLQGPSSPPISATEAEISNARLSDRMKGHAQEFSTYLSEVASLTNQLLRQAASHNADILGADYGPTNVPVTMPDSTVKSEAIEVQKLPRVAVRVVIDTDLSVKDKLQGQNLMAFTTPGPSGQSGMDSPYADITLGKLGFSDSEIKEFMARRGLHQELLPPGPPAGPPMGGPPQPQPQPQGGM